MLLLTYTKELKTYVRKTTWMWMLSIALFIIAKIGSNQFVLQYPGEGRN